MLWRCILGVLLFWNVFGAQAQVSTYRFSQVGRESGLSNNQVNAIYRDSLGFVWFGTTDGLNRFDGFNCRVFRTVPGDSTSLEDNFVVDLFSLPGQQVWVASKGTAAIYNPLTESFNRNYKTYLQRLCLPQSKPLTILKDRRGDFWFLFQKEGLYKYATKTKKAYALNPAVVPISAGAVTHVAEDAAGGVWVMYANGLLQQLDAALLNPVQTVSLLVNVAEKRALDYRFVIDRSKKFWVWVKEEPAGAYCLDAAKNTRQHFATGNTYHPLNNNLVRGIVQDRKGTIWIGTDHGGINLVAEQNGAITYLQNKEGDNGSLSHNSVEKLYKDDTGIVWVGTGKKGVSYLNETIRQFDLYRHETDQPASLPHNDISSFAEDSSGNLWVGTNGGGLLYFNRARNIFTQYKHNAANSNSLCNNVIVSLCLDHQNKLWIGTYLGGLDCFDGRTFTHFRNNTANGASLSDNSIWHLFEDKANVLWVGTLKGGLDRFNRDTKTFSHFNFKDKQAQPLHSNYVPVLWEDRQQQLWIGTDAGVDVLNKPRTGVTYYPHTNKPNSLSYPVVTGLLQDRRGLIWIGTRSGLNVLYPKTKSVTTFYTSNGLPDNGITNLVEDQQGNIWITTAKGASLLVLDTTKKSVAFLLRHFNEANNLQGAIFNENAALVTKKGELVLGGAEGFNIIDPTKIGEAKAAPHVVFTNLQVFNNDIQAGQKVNENLVLAQAMPYTREITLNYNENIISFEFVALDFVRNNQYAYKLAGFNKSWVFTNGENRKVTYTNLDPGTYYFTVKAATSSGVWEAGGKTIKLIIKPPFWKTPVAFLGYAILVAGLLFLARRYLLEKARMQFEVEKQRSEAERIRALDAVKTKFFTNVSHEFRTPLSLIISPLDRLLKNSTDPDQQKQLQLVQRNARRLLNLVNQLLDFRKMEVEPFRLQPTEGDVVRFIRETTCSFSDLSEIKAITLSFTTNVETFSTAFDKDKMEKILFNLLSNAFKYTPANGAIAVSILHNAQTGATDERLAINVSDTGIGIPAEKQEQIFERFFQNDVAANNTNPGTGIGLAITKEFVKLHKGTIHVTSAPDAGTTFTVLLPVPQTNHAHVPHKEVRHLIATPQPEDEKAVGKSKQAGQTLPTVLLVEDNDDFRFYLKDNLSQAYRVVDVQNGQQAWDVAAGLKPDIIISDVMMPHMDGIELAKRVKQHAALTATPMILLTAVGDEEMQLESYRLGVNDFMQKPFTFEVLAARMKNLVAAQKPARFLEVNPSHIEVTPADELFLKQVLTLTEKNMGNPDFTVEELSKGLFMHRAGVYRKVLALTGKTPIEFIRQIRLKRGAQLLEKSGMSISEIAYEVGFNNPKKFSQYFKEAFGKTPSEFQRAATARQEAG